MEPIEIKKNIYWVGAIDWDVRNFHGYLTQRGTTYNAYLIVDEKITLIDAVKPTLKEQLFNRIQKIINPLKIDYIISNHVEMDHSGAIPDILKLSPNAKVITSPNGEKGLKAHYHDKWDFKVMKSGDTISSGNKTFEFINTPMVHWPDNMVCYLKEDKLLFSNDAFGQHYASSERFDDESPIDIVMEEAQKYYANIVLPYGKQVHKAYNALTDKDIKMILPSHGIIWRKNINNILANYQKWVENRTSKKVLIVYDTMWKSTELLAKKVLYDTFETKGYRPEMKNLQVNHISDIMTDFMDAAYICVGSPTLNNNVMPNVAAFLTYLQGLSPGGRKAIAFGSYGWGGHSIGQIEEYLNKSKLDVVASIKTKYIPDLKEIEEKKATLLEIIE